jgi:hypothetical protein
MGCEYNFEKLSAKTTEEAVKEGHDLIARAAHDYGHAGYTGSFAECTGVELVTHKATSVAAADDWLDEHAEKWGPMLIVEVIGPEACFCAGAHCSS